MFLLVARFALLLSAGCTAAVPGPGDGIATTGSKGEDNGSVEASGETLTWEEVSRGVERDFADENMVTVTGVPAFGGFFNPEHLLRITASGGVLRPVWTVNARDNMEVPESAPRPGNAERWGLTKLECGDDRCAGTWLSLPTGTTGVGGLELARRTSLPFVVYGSRSGEPVTVQFTTADLRITPFGSPSVSNGTGEELTVTGEVGSDFISPPVVRVSGTESAQLCAHEEGWFSRTSMAMILRSADHEYARPPVWAPPFSFWVGCVDVRLRNEKADGQRELLVSGTWKSPFDDTTGPASVATWGFWQVDGQTRIDIMPAPTSLPPDSGQAAEAYEALVQITPQSVVAQTYR